MKDKKISYLKFIIIPIVLIFSYFAFNTNIKVREYNIENDLAPSLKIALITDLHSCDYGENQEELVNTINEQNPDIVLLGGDIFDDVMPNDNTITFLEEIAYKYPCYYVTGNHEYWSNDVHSMIDILNSYGVRVLNGDFDTISVYGSKINICGITDPDVTKYTNSTDDVNSQLERINNQKEKDTYSILLAHRPELINEYNKYDFDLILSGHAHGGQFRIPYILNGLYAPNQGFFPKYAGGRYDFDDSTFIVSRGLGKESTKMPRIFNPPEVVIINLEKPKLEIE